MAVRETAKQTPFPGSPVADGRRRLAVLIVGFVVVVAGLGTLIGALVGLLVVGLVVAGLVAVLLVVVSYLRGDAIVLRVSRAVPADPDRYQRFHNLAEGLCVSNGLPKPRLYVIHDPAPNALVLGRDARHASIAVTTGLLEMMNRVELEGVMAHELARIRGNELGASTLVVTTVGASSLLAELCFRLRSWNGGRASRPGDEPDRSNPLALVGYLLLPLSALTSPLTRRIVGPSTAVSNDLAACQITRYPPGLLSALEKLRAENTVTHASCGVTAHLWLAEPFAGAGDGGFLSGLRRPFGAHPPLDDRIALLREL